MNKAAFADGSIPVRFIDFDFSLIEPDGEEGAMGVSEVVVGVERMVRWVYQDPHHRNLNGVAIRSIIVSWLMLRELQGLTLTQLAGMYGLDKQSLGRWVDDFKRTFPSVRSCHFRRNKSHEHDA